MVASNCKKNDLLKFLSNFELLLWLSCNQIDVEVVISIRYGWNAITWAKIIRLGQFIQNLLGVKIHYAKL